MPGKDFVPHFYPGKVGEKNTSKTEPLLSQGIWPSFFFIPGRLWPKNPKIKQKSEERNLPKPAFRQNINNICVFAFKLLLETKECEILFWKSHFKLMCSFGLKVTWQCVGLELFSKNLRYCPWQVGVCCATSVPGRAAGRRIFLLSSERQEKFLPCLLLLWVVGLVFFFPFQFPVGWFAHESTQNFFSNQQI